MSTSAFSGRFKATATPPPHASPLDRSPAIYRHTTVVPGPTVDPPGPRIKAPVSFPTTEFSPKRAGSLVQVTSVYHESSAISNPVCPNPPMSTIPSSNPSSPPPSHQQTTSTKPSRPSTSPLLPPPPTPSNQPRPSLSANSPPRPKRTLPSSAPRPPASPTPSPD